MRRVLRLAVKKKIARLLVVVSRARRVDRTRRQSSHAAIHGLKTDTDACSQALGGTHARMSAKARPLAFRIGSCLQQVVKASLRQSAPREQWRRPQHQ